MIDSRIEEKQRKEALDKLRKAVKASHATYREIATRVGVSPSWVGVVLRGGYPYSGGYALPKNMGEALVAMGFDVPDLIMTGGVSQSDPASDKQVAYLRQLGYEGNVTSRGEATRLIGQLLQ